MDVPVEKVDETIKTGKESFVTLRFDVLDTLKGTGGLKSVEAVYRSGAESYNPAPKTVLALNGKEVLVFISDRYVVQEKEAIRPFGPDKAEQLRKEVSNQRLIKEDFARLPAAMPDNLHGTVRAVIDEMSNLDVASGRFSGSAGRSISKPCGVFRADGLGTAPGRKLSP